MWKKLIFLLLVIGILVILSGCGGTLPTLSNNSPTITSTANTSAIVGETYTYNVEATDPDGDTLIYFLVGPAGMTINSLTGLIAWTPTTSGDYNVIVEVSDGDLTDTQSFTITVEENGTYALRDIGPAGGYIFYDKGSYSNGWRYLEAAPAFTEMLSKDWGKMGIFIGGTEWAIGKGQSNTTTIIGIQGTGGPYAAQLCDYLEVENNGVTYSDWFLPSKDELNLMYLNLKGFEVAYFAASNYWSSSEADASLAWAQYFGSDHQYTTHKDYDKRVRASRAF